MALHEDAAALGRLVGSFGSNVEALLRKYREGILDREYQLGRVADAVTELYVSACVLNRLDAMLRLDAAPKDEQERSLATGRYYLLTAGRRIRTALAAMWDNDDDATTRMANSVLSQYK